MIAKLLEWLPLIVVMATLLGGIGAYGIQRRIDRNHQLQTERRRIYRDFVVQAQKLRLEFARRKFDPTSETYASYRYVLGELLVSVPDDVVKEILSFDLMVRGLFVVGRAGDTKEAEKVIEALHMQYLQIVKVMRTDTFPKSKFRPEEFASHIPPGIAGQRPDLPHGESAPRNASPTTTI